jgi:hypothetical protein
VQKSRIPLDLTSKIRTFPINGIADEPARNYKLHNADVWTFMKILITFAVQSKLFLDDSYQLNLLIY